ncbi:MAG: SDR family oxidoreductase [Maioricimonas sp. JB045]|uniref:SDR family oxidoreductase n=1 Tax=Maioricimonas sp. JC845 TaxID=3232138 RepID=UPI0034586712
MADQDRRRVVLTGVSRGLGRAMVDRFVEAGCEVFGCARSGETVLEIARTYGPPHDFACVDVSDDRAVGRWTERLIAAGKVPDLLINNAGLINASRELWKVPADEFAEVVDVNIRGVFHVIRHFLPAMIEQGRGVVVNFSSGWGRSVAPEVAPYCATKFAVEGLTLALAEELPPGLAAVALNPGVIATDLLRSCFGPSAEHYPSPDEWSQRAVPFLLSLGPQDNGASLTAPG